MSGDLVCEWFAMCDHPAVMWVSHPILGDVPVCQRCADKLGLSGEPIREDENDGK